MKMYRTIGILVIVLAVGTIVLTAASRYTIYSVANRDNDAQLVWNGQEAYLFIKTSRLGWRRSSLELVRDYARAILRVGITSISPTDAVRDVLVVKITATAVEFYDIADVSHGLIGVLDGQIYSVGDGKISRWTGSHFEETSTESIDRHKMARMNFENQSGWSGRSNVLSQPSGSTTFRITVGGEQWNVIARNNPSPEESKAIDLQRSAEEPRKVWFQDERMRYVDETAFSAFLKRN